MSLTGSLFAGVSGLQSNGLAISVISDNISNINTVGFKAGSTSFSSLVTGNDAGGGTTAQNRAQITSQGLISSTGIATDLSISGQGFFVVNNPSSGEVFYTRAGGFQEDSQGNLINVAGFVLRAWPLDNAGRLPGEIGNSNTTSSQLLESLQDVNLRQISGIAFATEEISLGLNLNAGEAILTGAGDTIQFPSTSINNAIGSATIIAPTGALAADLTDGDQITITPGLTVPFTFTYGGFEESDQASGGTPILGATSATGIFTGATDGDAFTIQIDGGTPVQFTYQSVGPNSSLRTFNNMVTLAAAINTDATMNARVVNDRIYISAADANSAVTFASVGGSVEDFTAAGPNGLGLGGVLVGTNRFNTLGGLKTLVDGAAGISAEMFSAASNASMAITVDDPLDTIIFSDDTGGAPPGLLTEFQLSTTGLGPVYDALALSGDNMASGVVSSNFTRNIRVFDSLGVGHDTRVSFAKAANNKWLVEVFAANTTETITTNPDGIMAFGTVEFNGDGTLKNVSPGLSTAFDVVFSNGSLQSTISLNLGTPGLAGIGQSDGLSQFAGPYTVQFAEQDGAPSGELSSIEINPEGFVIANFTNGESRRVFKVPLASFPNANGLRSDSGNVFNQSDKSGEFTLNEVGDAAVGSILAETLENANVELADELTEMIVAQRAFQANTKVISTVDELLEELNRI